MCLGSVQNIMALGWMSRADGGILVSPLYGSEAASLEMMPVIM